MRKVGQILIAGAMISASVSFVAIDVAKGDPKGDPVLRLAQAPPNPEDAKKKKAPPPAQPQPPHPQAPTAPQAQPPHPPQPPQAAPAQPPRPPQPAPTLTQPAQPPHPAPTLTQPAQPPHPAPTLTQPAQPPHPAPTLTQPAQPPHPAPTLTQPAQPPHPAPTLTQPAQPPHPAPTLTQPAQPPHPAPTLTQPAQPPRPPQNAPAIAAPAGPPQRPALAGPPTLPAPTAAQSKPLQRTNGPAAIMLTTPQGQPVRRVDQIRSERHEVVEGNRTVIREPDRVIVRENNGQYFIRHNDGDRFRYGARDVRVERRGNDNVTTVILPNGQRVVSVLDVDGRLLRRSRFLPDGREIIIIDQRPIVAGYNYYVELPPPILRIPRERYIVDADVATPALIYDTLMAPPIEQLDQPYSLDQIRDSYSLRERMPSIDIDTINFEFGSWEVAPDQVDRLAVVADAINRVITANPQAVFLIEGHTDGVGSDVDNLSLSDRRAETVALILSDKFGVPPENMVTQGYGKQFLKIPTPGPERRNRRVTVRNITLLLGSR
jgi:outer membrane protein OmpA-like peptidoglycan-associated protein